MVPRYVLLEVDASTLKTYDLLAEWTGWHRLPDLTRGGNLE
jgi:hypothetical protein